MLGCVLLRGKSASLGNEEAVGGDAQCGVVMKAAPASTIRNGRGRFVAAGADEVGLEFGRVDAMMRMLTRLVRLHED